jgi:hypothetical protein
MPLTRAAVSVPVIAAKRAGSGERQDHREDQTDVSFHVVFLLIID